MPERQLGDLNPADIKLAVSDLRRGFGHADIDAALIAWASGSYAEAAPILLSKDKTIRDRVGKLENILGPIFLHSRKRLVPTETGLRLLRTVARHRQELAGLLKGIQRLHAGQEGRVSISYYGPVGAGVLRDFLLDPNPGLADIQCDYCERHHDDIFAALDSRCSDLGIVRGVLPSTFAGKSMSLWCERVLLALPYKHRLADRDAVRWEDLADETFLISSFGPVESIRGLIERRVSPKPLAGQIVIRAQAFSSLMHMVGAGLGVSLALECILGEQYDRVVYRELVGPSGPDYITSHACWHEPHSNPALSAFLKNLARHYPSASAAR